MVVARGCWEPRDITGNTQIGIKVESDKLFVAMNALTIEPVVRTL